MSSTRIRSRTLAFILLLVGLVAAGCNQQGYPEQAVENLRSEKGILKDEVERLEDEVRDLERELAVQQTKVEAAPYETDADEESLDETEWLRGLAVAQRLQREYKRDTGQSPKIVDMVAFSNTVSKDVDIYWTPLEKAAFRTRFAAWYRRNK